MNKDNFSNSDINSNIKQNLENLQDLEDDELVLITDEEGNQHECVILDLVEFKNKNYVSLVPANSLHCPDTDIADLFIMEIESDGKNEYLKSIEDQKNYEEICQLMIERLSEDFDIEY